MCIIFSRFPRPGRCKTRLIDAVGPQGAARLQRVMTEGMLAAARELARQRPGLRVELHVAGAGPAEIREWLGQDQPWRRQEGQNLGERLSHSFLHGFQAGFAPIIVTASDCPRLDAATLALALDGLANHDVVLGPSLDGGYYLLGLRAPQERLFSEIEWGRSGVLAATRKRIAAAALSCLELPPLPDIDRPADMELLPLEIRNRAAGP
ncbi:MAG: TIGR04282 family arsenosugar biosynthesis glycosyltransferase [Thermodesulfobacteriota bacterium]